MANGYPLVRKTFKTLNLLSSKQGRRGLRHGVGMTIEHLEALRHLDPMLVLDIGANKGQFSLLARHLWPQAKVLAFEPLDGPASKFQTMFDDDPLVMLHRYAIGSEIESRDIHISRREDSSSLLPIGDQSEIFPGTEEVNTQSVDVAPLSELLTAQKLKEKTVAKIDVQGFELEVLKGFGNLLGLIDWLFVECSFRELYKGQALVDDVVLHLSNAGFKMAGVFGQQTDHQGIAVQADILFSRR